MDDVTGEVTDLLQQLIRNACVNDGTPGSGAEARSADLLASYLEVPGLDFERFEPLPGRTSLVARVEGTDPDAPSLMLMGHTDVVPVTAENWSRDPFGGELVDGWVWGRGAVDMLNLTASMAVALKRLTASGFRPRGTLVYLAVADEEALGVHGARHLTERERDSVAVDYVITETGGITLPSATGPKLIVLGAEKGTHWCKLRVKGTPGHASMPLRTDNALVTAAEVVRRLSEWRPETDINEHWRRFVEAMDFPAETTEAFLRADGFHDMVASLPSLGMARQAHACTHMTVAPTIVRGGTKINVIPDRVDLEVDIRTLPGQTVEEVEEQVLAAIGADLADKVEIVESVADPATASPLDTPLWDTLQKIAGTMVPGARCVPYLTVGATDARFFRRLGATAYGFGLFSDRINLDDFFSMFHGDDERVDQESLRLSTQLWEETARAFLAG